MADQTSGSPWDEPLPEDTTTKKATPTIVGDLSTGQNQTPVSGNAPTPAMKLKVPVNTEEKIGSKVDANTLVNQPNSTIGTPATRPQATNQPVANQARPVAPNQAKEPQTDFWQSVYGQAAKEQAPTQNPNSQPQPLPAATTAKPAPTVAAGNQLPNVSQPNQTNQMPMRPATPPVAPTKISAPVGTNNQPTGKLKTAIIAAAIALVILFAGGVFLTEEGLISIGLEKVYGFLHLETLWHGLPANSENAFAMSAVKMKSISNFAVSGTATITVNKSVKSNIITPLISSISLPVFAFGDQQAGAKIAAVLADTTLDTSPSATPSPSGSPTASPSVSGATTSTISSVSQITSDISASFSNQVSGASFNLNNNGANSQVQLVYSGNKLYLKTSDNIVYDQSAQGSWSAIDLSSAKLTNSPNENFFASNFSSSNFSIVGSRNGDATINGVRTFHYSGVVNLGDALGSFGLSNQSVQSVSADYWIGIKDHLLYRLDLKIIPNSTSAVSRIDLSLNFANFGGANNDYSIPASSVEYSKSASGVSVASTRDATRKSDLANIAKALASYFAANNSYPSTAGATEKVAADTGTLYTALVPNFLATLPIDPEAPTYYYGYKSDGNSYTLSAVLEDHTDSSGQTVGNYYIYYLNSK